MRAILAALAAVVCLFGASGALAQSTATPVLPGELLTSGCPSGQTVCYVPYSPTNPLNVTGTFSASLGGFTPSASGARMTPLTVTTSDSSGNLPTGTVDIITNTGANPIYCNVNAVAATTSDQLITASGGQFPFVIPSGITTLHCIATGGSSTANGLGGSGLSTPTSAGTLTVAVAGVTTTPSSGTITTHGTFQTALASNVARKGCTLVNTSTDVEYAFFGANGSAATGTSIPLAAASVAGGQGGSLSCAVGGLAVVTDNIAITSKTADGSATFVVNAQ